MGRDQKKHFGVKRWLVRIVLAGLIVALTVYILILSPLGQSVLRRQVEKILASVLAGRIELDGAKTDIWSHVDLYGLAVEDTASGRGSISIGHLRATYFLPALLRRRVSIRSVRLEDAVIDLRRDRLGRWSVLAMRTDTSEVAAEDSVGEKSEWRVSVGSFDFRDVQLRYRDEALDMDTGLSDVTGGIRLYGLDSLDVALGAGGGFLHSPWWTGLVDEAAVKGSLGSKGLFIQQADVKGPALDISGGGFVPLRGGGRWDLWARVRAGVESVTILRKVVPRLAAQGEAVAVASWQGSLDRPVMALDLLGRGLRWGEWAADSLFVEGRYLEDELLHAFVRLRAPRGLGDIRTKVGIPSILRHPRIGQYEVQAHLDSLDAEWLWDRTHLPLRTRGGRAGAQLWAKGSGVDSLPDEGSLTAQIAGWKGPDGSSHPISARVFLDKRGWRVESHWGANTIRGRAQMDRTGNVLGSVSADLREPGIPLLYLLGEPMDGRLLVQAELAGSFADPSVEIEVAGRDLVWREIVSDTLWALLDRRPGWAEIRGAKAEIHGDLEPVLQRFGITDVGGRLGAMVEARGDVKRPRLRVELSGTDVFAGEVRADSIGGEFTLAGDVLAWRNLLVRQDDSIIEGHGQALLSRTPAFQGDFRLAVEDSGRRVPGGHCRLEGEASKDSLNVSLRAEALDLAGLVPWIPSQVELGGTVTAEADLGGTRANPIGRANIAMDRPTLAGKGIAAISGSFSLGDSVAVGDGLLVFADSTSQLRYLARLPLRPSLGWGVDAEAPEPASLSIASEPFELAGLSQLIPQGLGIEGPAQIELSVKNRGATWVLDGALRVRDGRLHYDPEKMRLAGISADVTLSGDISSPHARFQLATGQVRLPAGGIDRSTWTGELSRQGLMLADGQLVVEDGLLNVSGYVPFVQSDSLAEESGFALRWDIARFPLVLLNPHVPGVVVRDGILQGNGQISVGTGGPSLSGDLRLDQGLFAVGGLSPSLGPVAGEWEFSGNSVVIRRLDGTWGRGKFHSKGTLAWDRNGLKEADVALDGKDLHFALPKVADVRLRSVDLRLQDQDERFLLKGQAVLGETRFIRDVQVADLAKAIRGAGTPARKPEPFLQKLDLDVEILAPQTLIVDVNLAKMRMDTRLALSRSAASPAITGEVKVAEGYLLYLDRKFQVTRGVFRQFDPFRLNPEMDFQAQTEVTPYSAVETPTTYRVTLSLSGDMDHPTLTLESDPALSRADVVSLLTLGRIRGGGEGPLTSEGEPGWGNILVQRAQSIASQQVTGVVERRMERLLKLESVTIEGDLFRINQGWGPRVTLTKRLAERLNLSYQTVVGHTNEQQMKISYRIAPFLYLDGETDERGRAGLDLRTRFRFK